MDGCTVLLIDGDADSLAIYSLILRYCGIGVLQTTDGEEGFELACARHPDLVVFEPYVPPVRGRALTDLLCTDPRTARLRMLAVTAVPGLLASATRAGGRCTGYLVKPCEPGLFLAEVQRRLDPTLYAA